MEYKLEIGSSAELSKIVAEEDSASKFGSGAVDVLASPVMFGLMESAALKCAGTQLPEGISTVGIHLESSHLAATPMGMKVTAKATLIEQDRKKLTFKIEAFDETEKIGEGTHTRFIIDFEKFSKKALSKK